MTLTRVSLIRICPRSFTDYTQRALHDPAPCGPLRKAQGKLHGTWKIFSRIREDTIRDVYLGLLPSSSITAVGQHGLRGCTSRPVVFTNPEHTAILAHFVPA
jgi:hypothetical protein